MSSSGSFSPKIKNLGQEKREDMLSPSLTEIMFDIRTVALSLPQEKVHVLELYLDAQNMSFFTL